MTPVMSWIVSPEEIDWNPNPHTGEKAMWQEAEVRMMHLQANEPQGLLANARS